MAKLNWGKRFSNPRHSMKGAGFFKTSYSYEKHFLFAEFHKRNADRKLQGKPPLTFKEFMQARNPVRLVESKKHGMLKNASSRTKAKINLPGQPPEEPKRVWERPKNTSSALMAEWLLHYASHVNEYIRIPMVSADHPLQIVMKLIQQGYLSQDPRNPEANTCTITQLGLDYVSWLYESK